METSFAAALTASPLLFATLVGILGAIVGSFLNVVILRLPRRLEHDWQQQAHEILDQPFTTPPPPGLVRTPSHCGHCQARIRPWHNVPVLGWLWLRGKCADCGTGISIQYPLIELVTALLSMVVAWQWGPVSATAVGLVFTWVLIALAGIDLNERLLPDTITLPLLWLGLLLALLGYGLVPLDQAVTGAIAGYMSLWVVFQLFRLVTGKEGMGYGDFKLYAALGAWLGWKPLILIILLASSIGALAGLALLLTRRLAQDRSLPFGPFLAAAGWVAMLWGEALTRQYLQLLMP